MSRHADDTALVRGASRGFTVLLLGGAVQPLVGAMLPPLGYIWLVLVAVVAFIWAARTATAPEGAVVSHGVLAALSSYLLVLPVVFMATGAVIPAQIFFTSLTAVTVGAAAAVVTRRRWSGHPA